MGGMIEMHNIYPCVQNVFGNANFLSDEVKAMKRKIEEMKREVEKAEQKAKVRFFRDGDPTFFPLIWLC